MSNYPMQRALLSVSDKTGIVELAKFLSELGVEIISSGGTGKTLEENNIDYLPIEKFTGNPEAFGGRMKTLSFQVGSALLFKRDNDQDVEQARQLNIKGIDLVVCNLYPFEQVYSEGTRELDKLVEYIDIGGPCMIRAAAKNFKSVCALTDPRDYLALQEELQQNSGHTSFEFRKKMAVKTFQHSAHYENVIAQALLEVEQESDFPALAELNLQETNTLRYGENPHQKGWVIPYSNLAGLASSKPLQGKELSYNNYLDADAALRSSRDLTRATKSFCDYVVTIIKHSNPCGAAAGKNPLATLEDAWSADPISSFGSIISFNHVVTGEQASWLADKFVEVILAPGFSEEAKELFAKKKNLRLLVVADNRENKAEYMVRAIDGGVVVQEEDQLLEQEFQSVTKKAFDGDAIKEVVPFGIMVTKHFKSNAIALVDKCPNGLRLLGAGMGNPNRLVSLKQAVEKARENGISDLSESILISDAFFPFADNIELAHEYGITKIVEPGGSIKDSEVIGACDKYNMQMVFTGKRHFRH